MCSYIRVAAAPLRTPAYPRRVVLPISRPDKGAVEARAAERRRASRTGILTGPITSSLQTRPTGTRLNAVRRDRGTQSILGELTIAAHSAARFDVFASGTVRLFVVDDPEPVATLTAEGACSS